LLKFTFFGDILENKLKYTKTNKKTKNIGSVALFDNTSRTFLFNHINLYLVALKISPSLLGIANTLFNLFNSFAKLFTPLLLNKFYKKRLTLIITKLIAFFIIMSLFFSDNIIFVMIVFLLIYLIDGFILVIRDSLFTELIDHQDKYYAKLFFYAGLGSIGALVIANILFIVFPKNIFIIKILFGFAGLGELISIFFALNLHKGIKSNKHTLKEQFLIIKNNRKFMRVLIGYSILFFAMMFIGPFIVQYIVDYLKLSFSFYAFFVIVFFISTNITQYFLSKIHHSYLRSFIIIGIFVLVSFPVLFLLFENPIYLLIVQFMVGFGFAILSYALLSYIVEVVDHKEKPLYISSFYSITTIPAIIAPMIGGYIFNYFDIHFTSKIAYIVIFAISFIIRLLSIKFFLEIPQTKKQDNVFFVLYKVKKLFLKRHN